MDPTVLVDESVEAGRRVVAQLDAGGFPVTAAYWYRRPEIEDWRMYVASPLADRVGGREANRMFDKVLSTCPAGGDVVHPPALVESLRHPRVIELRAFHGTDPAPYIGGNDLWRVYLYRAERLVPQTGSVEVTFAVRDKAARRWVPSAGTLTYADGLLVALTAEPGAARTRPRKHGLSARFYTLDGPFAEKGKPFAHLRRWEYSDGRLEVFREEVRPVPVADASPTTP